MKMGLTRVIDFGAMHAIDTESGPGLTGCDYKLFITVSGNVNRSTGIVINIVDIDRILKSFLQTVDGKLLNEDIAFFQDHRPTLENLLVFFWRSLTDAIPEVKLQKIKIAQGPFLYGEIEGGEEMEVCLTKVFHFSTAHRLHSFQISEEDNIGLFGKCNNLHGHGHNYRLEVTVKGKPEPATGTVAHYKNLEKTVQEHVVELFDHKHLNRDVEAFRTLNPTSEMLLTVIWDLLHDKVENMYKLGVWETDKNYFEYYGPAGVPDQANAG